MVGERTPAATLHDLHLLTTEIVTNAVCHADVDETATLQLRVFVDGDALRVSVTDPGGVTIPHIEALDVTAPGGMGLFIVDRVSDRWGFERTDDGATEVWFELSQAG